MELNTFQTSVDSEIIDYAARSPSSCIHDEFYNLKAVIRAFIVKLKNITMLELRRRCWCRISPPRVLQAPGEIFLIKRLRKRWIQSTFLKVTYSALVTNSFRVFVSLFITLSLSPSTIKHWVLRSKNWPFEESMERTSISWCKLRVGSPRRIRYPNWWFQLGNISDLFLLPEMKQNCMRHFLKVKSSETILRTEHYSKLSLRDLF